MVTITEQDVQKAEQRLHKRLQNTAQAKLARFDVSKHRLCITFTSGIELAVPCALIQGLDRASAEDLDEIEISPAGLGLHFPRLDADIYVPALLQGILGDRQWMAQQLGRKGGSTVSKAKSEAARANGKLGGRPRRRASPHDTPAPKD